MKIFTASPSASPKKDESDSSKPEGKDLSINQTKTHIQSALDSSAKDTALKSKTDDRISPDQNRQGVIEQKIAAQNVDADGAKSAPEKQTIDSEEIRSTYSIRKKPVNSIPSQLLSKDDLKKKMDRIF